MSSSFAAAVESGSADAIAATLHPDVEFSSPAVFRPYVGKDATMVVLRAVVVALEDFRYVARFHSPTDGDVLQFTARVNGLDIEGVDIVRSDADGLVTHLTVLIRPLKGLHAVVARMGELLAD